MSQSVQPQVEEILKRIETEVGEVPDTIHLLSKIKPDMVQEHARSKQFAFSQEALPEKYRQLIAIAAVAGAGVPSCIKTQVKIALRKGITVDEIVDTLVISRFALASTVFTNSVEALRLLSEDR